MYVAIPTYMHVNVWGGVCINKPRISELFPGRRDIKTCPDEKNEFSLGIKKSHAKKVVILYQKRILIQIKCDLICNYINRPCITS